MAFRRKRPPSINDPALDDDVWLEQGEKRFALLLPGYDDSPDALVQGYRSRLAEDDPAAALFFLVRAVERLEQLYVADGMARRQPGEGDRLIIGACWASFTSVNRQRPTAPIGDLATATSERLARIASTAEAAGVAAELVEPFRNVAADIAGVVATVLPPPPPEGFPPVG